MCCICFLQTHLDAKRDEENNKIYNDLQKVVDDPNTHCGSCCIFTGILWKKYSDNLCIPGRTCRVIFCYLRMLI